MFREKQLHLPLARRPIPSHGYPVKIVRNVLIPMRNGVKPAADITCPMSLSDTGSARQ